MAKPKLEQMVVVNSEADNWEDARFEWAITMSCSCPDAPADCVCDKQGIVDQFEITNVNNNSVLFPIGNECIKHFGRAEFKGRATLHSDVRKCLAEMGENNGRLEIKHLTKRMISASHTAGLIDAREEAFMVQMRNKRTVRSERQDRWLNILLARMANRIEAELLALPS